VQHACCEVVYQSNSSNMYIKALFCLISDYLSTRAQGTFYGQLGEKYSIGCSIRFPDITALTHANLSISRRTQRTARISSFVLRNNSLAVQ
jgi:hypothetical protein